MKKCQRTLISSRNCVVNNIFWNNQKRFKLTNIQTEEDPFRNELLTKDENYKACLSHSYITNQLLNYFTSIHEYNEKKELIDTNSQFILLKKETSLENIKGDGIFLKGSVKKGQVVCLYPGLVYDFSDPIFFQSIGNMFINQRSDYCRVDGNDRFVSKIYFKSYCNRDNIILSNGQYIKQCDSSWLNFKHINDDGNVENYWKIRKQYSILNHLNIGHYINSPVSEDNKFKSNVMYFEYDFLYDEWPYHLRQYIPNVFYKQPHDNSPVLTKSILLISLCDIESQDGQVELFANYLHLDS